jgi:hypothetical protein
MAANAEAFYPIGKLRETARSCSKKPRFCVKRYMFDFVLRPMNKVMHSAYMANTRPFLSAQNSPYTPPNTSLAFLCGLLPLAEAAYLASIVIGLHTTLYIG